MWEVYIYSPVKCPIILFVSSKSGRLVLKINLYPSGKASYLYAYTITNGKRITGAGYFTEVFSATSWPVSGMKIKRYKKTCWLWISAISN